MSESESDDDDDLRPNQLAQLKFGHHFFSESDDDEEVRDYDSSDRSSLPSFGSGPPNDMENGFDKDSSTPNRQFSFDSAPNPLPEIAQNLPPEQLPLLERPRNR